jgi:short-subunit dehydrogenase
MELTGKVAVVTGASMGIGEQIAKVFAERGAKVVLLSRDASRAEAARHRVGHTDRTLALACDVRKHEDIERVLSLTLRHFDRLDIWVNNAGHGLLDSLASADMAAIRQTFETNLFGAIDGMQAVIPVMKQQGRGTIINVSSVAGHIPIPFHAIYSGTKFAMNAVGKGARMELKAAGVHVLTVCPGYVRTDFGANALRGAERKQVRPTAVRGISPERVARAVLHGCVKQKREVVVPWYMHLTIKLYQLCPGFMEWAMGKLLRKRE